MTARIRHPQAAFTMIELLISGSLMSVILVAAYLCLSTGVASQRMVDARSDAAQSARVALSMIATDLRSAVPLSREFEFIGMRRSLEDIEAGNLDFATRNFVPKRQLESDWCETSYFVQKDTRTGDYVLLRRRDPTPDPEPLAGGSTEEIARGVRAFRLEYYDGWDWYDEWGDPTGKQKFSELPDPNVSGLPEAVRITLTLKTAEPTEEDVAAPEMTLQTTARLGMALFYYQSSSGSGSTNNNANAAGPSQDSPQGPPGGAPR